MIDRELVPAPPSSPGRPAARRGWLGVVALAGAALIVVLGASRVGGGGPPASTRTAPVTATTIVSAAADLLGRATTTSRPPTSTTAEVAPPTLATSPSPAPSATTGALPHLADAERVAQRFVEAIAARDCDGLWSLLGRTSQRFLTSADDPEAPDGRSLLCEGLRREAEPPIIVVRGPATARADGAAVVALESGGEVEELVLVHEDGRWVIDLFASVSGGS